MEETVTKIKHKLIEHYDADAEAYHDAHYRSSKTYSPLRFRQQYIEAMVSAADLPREARVLDVGCGPGELVTRLAQRGHNVWGIDISQGMIDLARNVLEAVPGFDQSRLAVGDIENLTFTDGFFDLVVASGVLEYQQTDTPAIREIHRVLKPNGIFILNVTNRYAYLNAFDATYRMLKRQAPVRVAMNFGKKHVLRRGEMHDLPDHRKHAPRQFDRTLQGSGFEKLSYNYFHFSPLPAPLDSILNKVCSPVGRAMEQLSTSPLAPLLAGGYIVMARKV